jgi:hypothetical protein
LFSTGVSGIIAASAAGVVIIVVSGAPLMPPVVIVGTVKIRVGAIPPGIVVVHIPISPVVRVFTTQFRLSRYIPCPVAYLIGICRNGLGNPAIGRIAGRNGIRRRIAGNVVVDICKFGVASG